MDNKEKIILDACCGGKMMWFDKQHTNAIYVDLYPRPKGSIKQQPGFECNPDIVMSFTKLDFPNKKLKLVVFDPPHLKSLSEKSIMKKKFGTLLPDWEDELKKGFEECWRVLDDYGILIFKWSESQVKISEVLKIFPVQPLFGHTTGKIGKTIWVCFMKI